MSQRDTMNRRQLLCTAGAATLPTLGAGCLGGENGAAGDDTQEPIDAPEPDTLQGNPIIYHGETYNINGTEYTVPDNLDRGPQTVQVDGEEIDAYISNQEFHETAIANQFADSMSSIGDDHIYPEEINVEGDTIQLKTITETEQSDNEFSNEIAATSGLYRSALNEDNIPYNFELEIVDGEDNQYKASIDSNMAQEYLDEEIQGGEITISMRDQII